MSMLILIIMKTRQKSEAKSKTYRDWLPNVSVAFPWEKTQITFSYARKIKRPAFHDLSDYNSYVSSFLYNRGNPYITPQLTDEWNTLATYGPISASITYSHIHKGIYADYQLSSINSDAVEEILRNYDDFSLLKCALKCSKTNRKVGCLNLPLPMKSLLLIRCFTKVKAFFQ